MKIQLKIGRNILSIADNDIVMDNGSCIQLITKEIRKGFDSSYPVLSKKLFNDLMTCGFLYTDKNLEEIAAKKYSVKVILYKFNIERMVQSGYDLVSE